MVAGQKVGDLNLNSITSHEWGSLVALVVKSSPANAADASLIPGLGRSPAGGHGNSFQYSCRKISWTEEPGGLQSMGSQRVGHD